MKITWEKIHPYLAELHYRSLEKELRQEQRMTKQQFLNAYARTMRKKQEEKEKTSNETYETGDNNRDIH